VCVSGSGMYIIANIKDYIPADLADCIELDYY
jgi:hypothetical protein